MAPALSTARYNRYLQDPFTLTYVSPSCQLELTRCLGVRHPVIETGMVDFHAPLFRHLLKLAAANASEDDLPLKMAALEIHPHGASPLPGCLGSYVRQTTSAALRQNPSQLERNLRLSRIRRSPAAAVQLGSSSEGSRCRARATNS